MKVLLVQNKPTLAAATKLTLLRQGYEVIYCQSTLEAIENILRHSPKMVVIDIMTPAIGVEFVSTVKMYGIPVIVLSKVGDEDHLQKAFDLGADDYLQQPYSMNELKLRISLVDLKTQAQA